MWKVVSILKTIYEDNFTPMVAQIIFVALYVILLNAVVKDFIVRAK